MIPFSDIYVNSISLHSFQTLLKGGGMARPPPHNSPFVFVWIGDLIVELLLVDGAHAPGQIDLNLGIY